MKKLTGLFLSLVLSLCLGVAFAQTAAPTITPTSETLSATQKVTIKTTTTGADVFYTLDGSTPTKESTKYTATFLPFVDGAIKVTVKAIAIKDEVASEVTEKTYKLKPETPKCDPPAGSVLNNTQVTLSCATPNAKIYYTTDGTTTPTDESTEYTESTEITITAETTIKAIAYIGEGDDKVASAVLTAKFPVIEPLGLPTFSPVSGTSVVYGSKVTFSLTGAPSGTKYYYTANGTDPKPTGLAATSVTIKDNVTVKVIAVNGNVQSGVATADYTCKLSTTALTPATGEKIKQGTKIKCEAPAELETSTGLENFWFIYAEGDGAALTTDEESLSMVEVAVQQAMAYGWDYPQYPYALYDLDYKIAYVIPGALDTYKWYFAAQAPETDGEYKIRGRAVILGNKGNLIYGDMMSATYTVEGAAIDDKLPTFSVAAGEVEAGTEVTLTPGENGDAVLYVIDGDEENLTTEGFANFKCFMYMPGADEDMNLPYSNPIKIYKGQTIKAASVQIMSQDDYGNFVFGTPSAVASATYTVKDGADESAKVPTVTVTPVNVNAVDVKDGMTVEFTVAADPKVSNVSTQEDGESVTYGFVIRANAETLASLAKLEYRLSNEASAEWVDFGEGIQALNYGQVIAAIPDNFTLTEAKTVYYRMTLQAVAGGGDLGGGGWGPGDWYAEGDDAEEGDEEPEGTVTMPVIAFEIGNGSYGENYYGGIQSNTNNPFARTPLDIRVIPAAPAFEPASGAVDFGTQLTLTSTEGAWIYYTTDDSEPSEENGEAYSIYYGIKITEPGTIKAIAVLDGVPSTVSSATYTINPIQAKLSLAPMLEDSVGMNIATGIEFSVDGWEEYPDTVYYTVDGTTVPSREAYAAQTDKENGAIKMLTVEWSEEEDNGGVSPYSNIIVRTDGHALPITFTEATRLKAIGYMALAGQNVVTPLLDTMLQIKAEKNPTFSLASGKTVKEGDKVVIENPNAYPEKPVQPEELDWTIKHSPEELEAYKEAWNVYNEEFAKWQASIAEQGIPATKLYFSFDGTEPSPAAYDKQKAIETENGFDYSSFKVFKTEAGMNVDIFFGKDAKGFYANVPAIDENIHMGHEYDTIRLEADGRLSVQVLAVTGAAEEGGDYAAKAMPGGSVAFTYGSEFVKASYSAVPATITFDPVSGSEVDENTAVSITCSDATADIFYMMFESEAAAKAAAWDQEKAELYSEEMKPVLSAEKATIKAAYAREGAEVIAGEFFYATYKVKEVPAITLTFNPASGSEVDEGTEVTVTANRETEISYNLYADKAAADADTLFMTNAKDLEEDGKPVITKAAPYLRCAVFDKGEVKYFDATYIVRTANEDLELAGVSVYPNPSNGMFNLELPVASTVEVFAINGVLMQRFNASEGNATLTINRSGIYFLRITGEGRTAIKRVIVR